MHIYYYIKIKKSKTKNLINILLKKLVFLKES